MFSFLLLRRSRKKPVFKANFLVNAKKKNNCEKGNLIYKAGRSHDNLPNYLISLGAAY